MAAARTTNTLVGVLAALSIVVAAWWVWDRLTHVHVVDARIAASMITVSPRVQGWLSEVLATDGQTLEVGDIIARIDDREARLSLNEADARLQSLDAEVQRITALRKLTKARVAARIAGAKSSLAATESALLAARAELTRVESDWQRASPLLEREIISREIWELKRSEYEQAQQSVLTHDAEKSAAHAHYQEALVGVQEMDVLQAEFDRKVHERGQARAQRDRLAVILDDHSVTSPINGVVDETFVDPGEHVRRGQPIVIVHDPNRVWVRANIKETDVRHLAIGTAAKITVDAYPGREFAGLIAQIGNAATSQFRLLPNPNPSGNFTKITQRLEVHIEIEQDQGLLKPGMMVEVEIDI